MTTNAVLTMKVTYDSDGLDQLGNQLGKPNPGDTARVHVKGYYISQKPSGLFRKKNAKKPFIDTHSVGETAFVDLQIPKQVQGNNSLVAIFMDAVRTMKLGDAAETYFVSSEQGCTERIKGWIEDVPPHHDVVMQIDLFRIVRDGKEHRRKTRNGSGGAQMSLGGMG